MVVYYLFITSSLTGHPPPQEDIDLKPNLVYGVSGSGMYYSLVGKGLRGEGHAWITDQPSSQGDVVLQPNPVYGVGAPQESQDYDALDHIHKTGGDINDTYDYVN